MNDNSWFYPTPKRSKHEICLNHGDWDGCCGQCNEEWCKYGNHEETKEIMIRDASRYDLSVTKKIEEESC